jgi:uncharacterized protein YacL (UPF0231 family)
LFQIQACQIVAELIGLVEFLTLEVQNSLEWVREILAKIDALESGEISQWTRLGNAYHVTLSPERVTLENLAMETEPIEEISLSEFKEAAIGWQHQIEHSGLD